MRRVFRLNETSFKQQKGLLKELTNYVVESLGSVYPEMERNIATVRQTNFDLISINFFYVQQIQQIIDYEEEIYNSLKSTAAEEWKALTKDNPNLSDLDMPGLIQGFKEIKKLKTGEITPKLAFKLYDTYGLDEEIISTLAVALKLKFNAEDFQNEMKDAKIRSKEMSAGGSKFTNQLEKIKHKVAPTVDHYKYSYKKEDGRYVFEDLGVEVVAILKNGKIVEQIEPNTECSLILDKTNFYGEAGGQEGDRGIVKLQNGIFKVTEVKQLQNYVLHNGIFESNNAALKVGEKGVAKIDADRRINAMRNHTGVHLLNAALKKLDRATCQKSSRVTDEFLSFDVGIFGDKLSVADSVKVEKLVNKTIKEKLEVKTTEVDSQLLYGSDDITLIPGEVYPENDVRLIEIFGSDGFVSRSAEFRKPQHLYWFFLEF